MKKTLLLGLFAAGMSAQLHAAEPAAPVATAKSSPAPASPSGSETTAVMTGKVMVVDKSAQTVTLEFNGKLYLLKLGTKLKMVHHGKPVTIDTLAAGQEIAVLVRKGPDGVLEVLALSVDPSQAQAEAAGGDDSGRGRGGSRPKPPFPNLPDRAREHIPPHVISKHQ